ncbi:hypothetical protein GH714_025235 [Hevea brasiliensis]|uniref:FAM86 N-terminal domain-containing protein n=1 Tax=Hevea brasiliensis TaxID=3981 RepID=A0A6A6M3T8_HEVBR|nr:hypothetical protein GH714_025235 [Hevea brasiliensis]
MANSKLDPTVPPGLHLVSAFLAMEPTDSLISIARACGGGLVTERVQRFVWDYCIGEAIGKGNAPYLKNFLKKLIFEIESSHSTVLDELYEQYGYYMTSLKDDISGKGNTRVCKCISFLFPDGCSGSPSCPMPRKLMVPLHCSLNMLEGDTGCAVWPASLYLSEFVLSFPNIFFRKSCFEVGSGVGLVGICLYHVKASKVILSDGDLSTLANMKLNLELNQLRTDTGMPERSSQDLNMLYRKQAKAEMDNKSQVNCIHLPWESATKNELQEFMPDIVLGADIIYDPSCLPYLVQLLAILLNIKKACSESQLLKNSFDVPLVERLENGSSKDGLKKAPVAYIAAVIRNIETFSYFLQLAELADLAVTDITETLRALELLPYMQSYDRSSIPIFEKVVPPSFLELGLAELVSIYSDLSQLGKPPVVIDAADLQQDPEGTLCGLCEDLEIPFDDAMLRWEAGPKPIDGVWAPWWYKSVHQSTSFNQTRKYPQPFPFSLYDLLEKSLPLYNMLRRHVRKTTALLKSPLPPPDIPVPANEKLLAWVGDEILPRESAKVSVFDSVVQGGDSVWEGLRVYNGKIFKLEEHLDRLFDSAKALAFKNVPTREEVKEAIFRTLIRNGMFDNAHIRLSLTRGKKVTSGMSPAFNLYGCTLIVLPEWKPPVYDNTHGINLVTATTRRNSPNNLDSKIHHNNLLNNILAKIEGNNADAGDAIMLDKDGYVSETNATNIFLVKKGRVLTPQADYCLPGITRAAVMDLVVKEDLVLEERRISLSEFHTADEVWTTGTMGELTPVVKIDGREIGDGKVGPVTQRLQNAYKKLTEESGVPIPSYQH